MKYLKTFESNKYDFKTYLLYKVNPDIYFILKFVRLNGTLRDTYITTNKCYSYSKILNNLVPQHAGYRLEYSDDNIKDIIYQSDNIQDCLDVIHTLKDTEKYNI